MDDPARKSYAGFSHSEVFEKTDWVRQLTQVPHRHTLPEPPNWWIDTHTGQEPVHQYGWRGEWADMSLGERVTVWLMAPEDDWVRWGYLVIHS